VIIDFALQQGRGFGGLDLIRRLRLINANLPILVFSIHSDPLIVSRALEAGGTGYLRKDTAPEDLVEAFDKVRRGIPYLGRPSLTRTCPNQTRRRSGLARRGVSRFTSLFVIARNSSFTYKGKAVDIKQVGRELGVRYVLEGSVRKMAERVRITGQLIQAATGAHIWADWYDGDAGLWPRRVVLLLAQSERLDDRP
jgi:DNA-binding response OmpR family regulator